MAFLSSSVSILTVKERRLQQVVFLCYTEEAFIQQESVLAVTLMLMLCAWAPIPSICLSSFCFDYPGSACAELIVTLTVSSTGSLVLVTVTSEKDLGYTVVSESLDHTFLRLPGHCLGMAFSNLCYNFELRKFCSAKSLNQTECTQVCIVDV
ncbi:ATP-binding cassette sub-family A member 17-like isoform X2 [Phacochoerus africanus]|uniref:ATP-binding cassette sub-family A member 17-like isoform X2 n=1 Tax=Phacochoerus africanus TaxID=41426 RepID=UPI001FD944AD|nr:ATP-binding cassette sub-family A member 17-like isoform X2 [Phacochoerus africanus]